MAADGIIKFAIYPVKLRVYFSLAKYLKDFPARANLDYTNSNAFAVMEDKGPCVVYIADVEPSLVVHEAVHSAWDVLDYVGVKVTYDNHEALTYLTDYIFTKTLIMWNNRG